jgi:hypothetical protein
VRVSPLWFPDARWLRGLKRSMAVSSLGFDDA